MVVCKDCGKSNQPHYAFCLHCGSPLEGPARGKDMSKDKQEPAGSAAKEPDGSQTAKGAMPPIDVDTGETPLPMPRPPPSRFSGEGQILQTAGDKPVGDKSGAVRVRAPEVTLRPDAPMRGCKACAALSPIGFQFCGQCGGKMDDAEIVSPHSSGAVSGGRLVLVRPDGSEGGTHVLSDGVNLVGRGSGPLFDADSYLSPLHLQIEVLPGGTFTVRDAGSLNGVFIKLTEEEPVGDGAVFRLGQELLRFDAIRPPRPLEDGTEIMGSPNPGYWGRIAIIIGRAQDGSCFPLFGDAIVLGRERGDILFAEDGYVSGTHARISYRQGQVFLQDLASSNGTFLKVRDERTVRSGTFVLMGQQLFRMMAG